jgi:phosphoglycerate dehydrogenase-like enzyme
MSKPKVLVFAVADTSGATHKKLEAAGYEVLIGNPEWMIPGTNREDEVKEIARDVVAMCGTSMRSNPLSRRIMESAQRLRIVAKYTVGVDDVDVDGATDLGILVTHAPTEANCFGVAETTMALMLGKLKDVRERDRAVREGRWRDEAMRNIYLGRRESDGYRGITLGIVGMGRIGSRLAELIAPWRLGRVIGYDPYVDDEKFIRHGVARISELKTVLNESDVVTLHCNLTKETRHMLNAEALKQMKKSAILINCARGRIMDEHAVAAAIADGTIAGACIDAFADEPLAKDSPLRKLGDKVLLSPHGASHTVGGGLGPGIEWATRSVLTALDGGVPDNVYNKEAIERWQGRFGGAKVLAA